MDECIFCNIVKKDTPASIIFEDELSLVIEPLELISQGHVLVLPKQHSVNLLDIDDSTAAHLVVVAKNVGKMMIEKHNAKGMNLLHAAGKEAQQSVFHTHFHVVPRYENDGLDLWFRNNL